MLLDLHIETAVERGHARWRGKIQVANQAPSTHRADLST